MSDAKLMPCPNPWCKSGADPFVESMSRGPAYVACYCGMRGPTCGWAMGQEAAEARAIAAWNTRPGPQREAEDGEVVRYESYAKLEAEVKRIIEALKDSATVHSNILTGRIALTEGQAIHIAGLPADIKQRLAELELLERLLRDFAVSQEMPAVSSEPPLAWVIRKIKRLKEPVTDEEWRRCCYRVSTGVEGNTKPPLDWMQYTTRDLIDALIAERAERSKQNG